MGALVGRRLYRSQPRGGANQQRNSEPLPAESPVRKQEANQSALRKEPTKGDTVWVWDFLECCFCLEGAVHPRYSLVSCKGTSKIEMDRGSQQGYLQSPACPQYPRSSSENSLNLPSLILHSCLLLSPRCAHRTPLIPLETFEPLPDP